MKWTQLLSFEVPDHPCTDINLEDYYRISNSTKRNKLIDLFWRTYFSASKDRNPSPTELLKYHAQILFRELELKYTFLDYFTGIKKGEDNQEIEFINNVKPELNKHVSKANNYVNNIDSPDYDLNKMKELGNIIQTKDISAWFYKKGRIPPTIPELLKNVAPTHVQVNRKNETATVEHYYFNETKQNPFKHHTDNIKKGVLSSILVDAIEKIENDLKKGITFTPFNTKPSAVKAVRHFNQIADEDYSISEKAYIIHNTYKKKSDPQTPPEKAEYFNFNTIKQALRRENNRN